MVFHVGVSGFSYPGWKGAFYPKDLKSEEFLAYYSTRLTSAEINSSFYAAPSQAMVRGWAERTKQTFTFAFKAPRTITHTLKLGEGSPEAAERFSKTLELLGPRRGPILFQLPPYCKADLKLLERFLSGTSSVPQRVFEFRHESWLDDQTYRLLDKSGVGFCIAETEDLAPRFQVTGGFAYFRLRNNSYQVKEVDYWAKRIARTARGVPEVYVYLRHDEMGQNALHAQRLSAKLGH